MTVLLVDDSKIMRMLLKNVLTKHLGTDTVFLEAENGEEAISLMKNNRVHLMMLDWNMPVMTGDKVVEAIRADPAYNATRIIMATTESSKARVVEMIKQGVNGYLVKPFQEANIIKAVETLRLR